MFSNVSKFVASRVFHTSFCHCYLVCAPSLSLKPSAKYDLRSLPLN